MNAEKLLELKKMLDNGIISQEEFEKEKGKLLTQNDKKKNKGFIAAVVCVCVLCLIIISSNFSTNEKEDAGQVVNGEGEVLQILPEEFSTDIPIEISGKIYDNIIGVPELSLSIKNKSNKDISAIKVYFLPRDVYNEEVRGIFVTNELYTDNTIPGGKADTKTWQMLDSSIKSGEIYVYSVYFADGTEWGDKDAAVSDIKKYGYKLEVKY